ncbi:transposase [Marinobacterium aestuarii]|uniref:Transposase n=1 Tax=Marinobacterium aestuarii TaxID=1821621 RepID=A0A1A9EWH6_9GAMM|nr:transposase [Marinobacterium aestuarii]ANG62266.1 transposase [Marinobacterium aestuarii]ANG63826.1 transposase [Marinobacterium aestuarii]
MNQNKTNSYTAEFREAAVKLAVESDQSISQTARELGVNVNTLHTWIRKYHGKQDVSSGNQVDDQHLYDELKKLRRDNARLKEERELLKKAAAFFAKESR